MTALRIRRALWYCGTATCAFTLLLPIMRSQSRSQPKDGDGRAVVEYFEQDDLPIRVSNGALVKKQGFEELTGRIANLSDEQVSGVVFLMIALTEDGKISGRISWVEKLDLEAGELRAAVIRLPKKISVPLNGKLVLGVDEIFGHRSIWIASKVEQALEAYGTGATVSTPRIKRVTNLVDSPNRQD